jgi:hypothetical protein
MARLEDTLLSEANRIRMAYLFDPLLAVRTYELNGPRSPEAQI